MKYAVNANGEYYIGKTYTHQGASFPCTSGNEEDAKVYKSQKIAQNTLERLESRCDGAFSLIEIE